ncbi:MAG: DegT/DnrJ/EryC1/StrS family aminotransferase [Kiritimatiellae bacterium]|nr:DegT/DnrJ/EryC1/StrS family aminotransferase [Kiritimatiellia bacterium]
MISVFGSKVGQEEIDEVRASLERQWMGIGPKVKKFEEEFTRRLGLTDFAMLDSGSNSLYMAVKLLNLPPGTEVILPSFTWISCAHAVVLCGCVPVFCDVDLDTHNVMSETIEPHITPKTGAIMVVHYAGKPVHMEPILGFGLPVIEDAAHAVDSKLNGKSCGAIGSVGIYSFDAVKNLATPDAGGLTAQDPELVARTRTLRYCGIGKSGFEASANKDRWWEYNIIDFFPRFLPNDITASVALAQLRKLDQNQARRRQIWELYQREFSELGWLVCPMNAAPNEQHSYFTYCIRVSNSRRDRFAKYMYNQGIYTTLRYHPLHLNPIYKSNAKLPVCEQLNEEALSLPLHPSLSESDVAQIIETVKAFRF